MGDHVRVRRSEAAGFRHRGVIAALSVDGARETNKNRMIVFSGSAAAAAGAGYLTQQCAPQDMVLSSLQQSGCLAMGPALVRWLRCHFNPATRTITTGTAGGAQQWLATLKRVAPVVLDCKDALSIADMEWFVRKLGHCTEPGAWENIKTAEEQ